MTFNSFYTYLAFFLTGLVVWSAVVLNLFTIPVKEVFFVVNFKACFSFTQLEFLHS